MRILDQVLNQLQNMASSPQPVPISNSAKSPSQEVNGLSNSYNSTCSSRWKRSSPDPNKMMLGKSPNILEPNVKRNILSSTPSRRNSHMSERVGSPSLSGYPVSLNFLSKYSCVNFFSNKKKKFF